MLDKLKENPKNPRTLNKAAFEKLKNKIKSFPEMLEKRPIVYDEDFIVLGGNQRLKVLRELVKEGFEIKDSYFMSADGWSDEQKKQFIITDNVSDGSWDDMVLQEEWSDLPLQEWGVDVNWEPKTFEDEPPSLGEDAVSKQGEVYHLGKHRLMCGDATSVRDIESLMGGCKSEMVFTDPPYNIDYRGGMSGDGKKHTRKAIANDKMSSDDFYKFLYGVMSNLMRVNIGAFYICMSSSELHNLWKAFTDAGGHWQTYLIWAKDTFTLSRSDYQHQFEPLMYGLSPEQVEKVLEGGEEEHLPIMYGWKRHLWYGGRRQGDVWRFPRPKKSKEHPTMKPVALCAKAIVNSSKRGDIVLDVFAGAGSTLMACEQTDRVCYSMELDPLYCDVIRRRYWKFINNGSEDGWQDGTPIANDGKI